MERTNGSFAVEFRFVHAPFSLKQDSGFGCVRTFEFRARHLKACLKLPATSASDVLYLDKAEMGFGLQSLVPIYAKVCADMGPRWEGHGPYACRNFGCPTCCDASGLTVNIRSFL